MGLFSRRGTTDPDDALPVLTRAQADRLRALVLAALTDPRHPAPVDGGSVVLSAHGAVGLSELAARAAALPEQVWADLVRQHLAPVLAPPATGTDLASVRNVLLPRLLSPAAAGAGGDAGSPAEGLVVRFALDLPDRVQLLTDLAPLGGFAAVAPVADANLRRLPAPAHHVVPAADGSPAVHAFVTDDLHGASRLLALDAVLAAAGVPLPPAGALVAVPDRHVLLVHPITGTHVVEAMTTLVTLTTRRHAEQPGAVSPDVYHRGTDGTLLRVTARDADGRAQVLVHGAFADAMATVGVA
jgi:hypothetical protein